MKQLEELQKFYIFLNSYLVYF